MTQDVGEHLVLGPCENSASLVQQLQKILSSITQFVLALDDIDQQREAHPTLLPALARLGDMVPAPHLSL